MGRSVPGRPQRVLLGSTTFLKTQFGADPWEMSLEQGILLLCSITAHILQVLPPTLPSPASSGCPRGLAGERLEGGDMLEPQHLSPPSAFKAPRLWRPGQACVVPAWPGALANLHGPTIQPHFDIESLLSHV